jgi:hypothetical protein
MTTQTTVMDDQFVALRVRYELRNQGRSGREVARELDMPSSSFHRRLSGDTPFSAVEIGRIAEILGVDVTVFFPPVLSERAS